MAERCKISAAALVAVHEGRSFVHKLAGYSRVKKGECVSSAPFTAGGHSWSVNYYPNGRLFFDNYVVAYLLLHYAGAGEDVKARFTLSVLDKDGEPVPSSSHANTHTFTSKDYSCGLRFFKKAHLEGSVHLRGDCLTIGCDVTIVKEVPSEERFVVVPPSDLHRHLGGLLKTKDAADVTFLVNGQRFAAHRCVLAARSSVFKAELLGAMKENSPGGPIEICDMEADVFESLLHFVYTDSVPPVLESGDGSKGAEARRDLVMAGHLLVAADRYNIGRLKSLCEKKLCDHIDSDMVATSLALAEQHGFHGLKEACFKFLTSPSNLKAMMASDGFEHLKSSCPSVLKELIVRILPAELKVAKDLIMAI